jgi:hypothetical protein
MSQPHLLDRPSSWSPVNKVMTPPAESRESPCAPPSQHQQGDDHDRPTAMSRQQASRPGHASPGSSVQGMLEGVLFFFFFPFSQTLGKRFLSGVMSYPILPIYVQFPNPDVMLFYLCLGNGSIIIGSDTTWFFCVIPHHGNKR